MYKRSGPSLDMYFEGNVYRFQEESKSNDSEENQVDNIQDPTLSHPFRKREKLTPPTPPTDDHSKAEAREDCTKHLQKTDRRRCVSWSGQTSPFSISPVKKSDYSSLRQSSASVYLASFALSDSSSIHICLEEGVCFLQYKLGRLIGLGAYSECREGICLKNPKEKLAFKIVSSNIELASIDHEVEIWSQLQHRGFLPLIDVVRFENATVIVSPLAKRGNILEYLSKNDPFTLVEAKKIFKALAEALRYLHNELGIVHRDIKLENILLDERLNPYLCDFGLSEYVDSSTRGLEQKEEMMIKGSLWYLAPEIIDDNKNLKNIRPVVDRATHRLYKTKADVWSLGVVLYAMISGALPFTEDYLPRLQQQVVNGQYQKLDSTDRDLCDLMEGLLNVDVERRLCIAEVLRHPWIS